MKMVTFSPLNVPALLHQFGIRPSKGLGQNFLVDETILHEIVARAGLDDHDTVLEIGPGLGSLTRYLAQTAGKVVAVELDRKLFPVMESILSPFSNIELIQGDILELEIARSIPQNGYQVVANIPYYITSAVIRHLLESRSKPRRITLTVQKEIAERICASQKMSLLAVSVQVYGTPSIQMQIPAAAFYPPPKVDSAVVQIEINPSTAVKPENMDIFFKLAKAGFGQKRKTLRNSLSAGMQMATTEVESVLSAAGIDSTRRAETLGITEWGKLTDRYLERRSR